MTGPQLRLIVIAMSIEPHRIADDFGRLVSVHCHLYKLVDENEEDIVSAFQLKFENGEVFHEALGDTDELSCASTLEDKYQEVLDVSDKAPWIDAIGKEALWIWTLTNQQGYNDAIQYSFANSVKENKSIIGLVTAASEITIYEICKSHNQPLKTDTFPNPVMM